MRSRISPLIVLAAVLASLNLVYVVAGLLGVSEVDAQTDASSDRAAGAFALPVGALGSMVRPPTLTPAPAVAVRVGQPPAADEEATTEAVTEPATVEIDATYRSAGATSGLAGDTTVLPEPASMTTPTSDHPGDTTVLPEPASVTTPTREPARTTMALPPPVVNGKGATVYLTFDCEGRGVPEVMAILRANHVHATMFIVGTWAASHPALVRQMVADGHVLGNHSETHPVFPRLSLAQARSEIQQAEAAIVKASGGKSPRPLFRFPYGSGQNVPALRHLVADAGYTPLYWSVDPEDWRGYPSSRINQTVLSQARGGSIVLLHPAAAGTPGALQAMIDGLRTRGFRFGTL